MYSLAVEAPDRGRLSEDEICAQLLFILNDAPCLIEPSHPIGLLSSQDRTLWAKDRENLIKGLLFKFIMLYILIFLNAILQLITKIVITLS